MPTSRQYSYNPTLTRKIPKDWVTGLNSPQASQTPQLTPPVSPIKQEKAEVPTNDQINNIRARVNFLYDSKDRTIPFDLPIGSVIEFAGIVPLGWLACSGDDISRIAYSRLFNSIGTAYGSGDGTTTFGLPNKSGYIIYTK